MKQIVNETTLRAGELTTVQCGSNETIKRCGYMNWYELPDNLQIIADGIIKELRKYVVLRGTEKNLYRVAFFMCKNKNKDLKYHLSVKFSNTDKAGVLKGSMRSVGKLLFACRLIRRKSSIAIKLCLDLMSDLLFEIHHVDSDIWNNSPSNLLLLTIKQHNNLHDGKLSLQKAIECSENNTNTLLQTIIDNLY